LNIGFNSPFQLFLQGAAVAYVAELLKVPAIFVKAVTDIIDGDKPTAEEFLQNLAAVTAALDLAVEQVINFINGKRISELWQPNFRSSFVINNVSRWAPIVHYHHWLGIWDLRKDYKLINWRYCCPTSHLSFVPVLALQAV